MQLSQIFLTDDESLALPAHLNATVETVRRAFPNLSHTIYNDLTLRAFIGSQYGAEVLNTYDALRPYSYRADLGRYCLLHAIGGWYFDIGVSATTGIQFDQSIKMIAFRDGPSFFPTSWACATGVIYSAPGNPVFRTAIELILRNRREEYYGISPLCPTGPHLFGEALAINRGDQHRIFGDYVALTPAHSKKNMAFVLPDGTIVAWGKQAKPGDLSALGVAKGNNYVDLWNKRQIYAK